ncbi:hypothetical protein FJZ18_00180 [Candidatus Pacearchaeota archaeon]|nr:hypothetical protein [Candidatus Pacearchaeota archaeon]
MKFLDFAILILFFIVVGLGAFIIFIITSDNTPYEGLGTINQNKIHGQDSQVFGVEQFYPNIRFPEKDVSYSLDPSCEFMRSGN